MLSHLRKIGNPGNAPSDNEIQQYHSIIYPYIPYYQQLDDAGKLKFIDRAWKYRQSKQFHFLHMPEETIAPILISAAAVQLTFGLDKYQMDYFEDIYILPDAYSYPQSEELFIGHVAPDGIYLSWKHFLQGYADVSDNVNVAIHEMAHALQHNFFMEKAGVDPEFETDFEKLPPLYGPALARVMVNKRCYLRSYAYTNIQEFWAVSVEAFFENPQGLKDNMPALYNVIGNILNQDPAAMILGKAGK